MSAQQWRCPCGVWVDAMHAYHRHLPSAPMTVFITEDRQPTREVLLTHVDFQRDRDAQEWR